MLALQTYVALIPLRLDWQRSLRISALPGYRFSRGQVIRLVVTIVVQKNCSIATYCQAHQRPDALFSGGRLELRPRDFAYFPRKSSCLSQSGRHVADIQRKAGERGEVDMNMSL